MKKTFKKALSVLLVAVMVFGSAPLAGFVGIELPEFNLFGTKAEAATSGYFTYSVSNNRATITDVSTSISGSVTIPATLGGYPVTSIGSSAFYGCTGLTSITIPDSVTSIGYAAFSRCSKLTSVTIPNSVTSIGYYAFENCTRLTSITIPDSVTSIGNSAFSGCTRLKSVTIPDSVTSIGGYAFYGCTGLTSITLDENNPNYSSDEYGVLFNKDKTELIQYPVGNKRTEYIIPDSVTSIGDGAFYGCTGLTSVTIGNGVTSIGDGVFYNCPGLTSITIPDSVTSIGIEVFRSCTGLTSVTIPNSVTSIGYYAFENCTRLTSVTIGNGVTSIGDGVFYNCTGLTSITVDVNNPNYSSDEYGVLFNKDKYKLIQYPIGNKRTEYIIPDSVTSIGGGAFYYCTGLTSVTIGNGVTSIGNSAFSGCDGLTSVTIPDSVTSIGDHTFSHCTGLTSITIPDSVTSIGEKAFFYCDKLTSITIPDSVTSIGSSAFYGCTGLTSITIPDSVTSIGEDAFYDCTGLTSITITDSVTSIGYDAFYNTGIYNDSSNWENGVLYIGNYLIKADPTISGKYSIKPGIKVLADYGFSGCIGLTSITIPDSVTSIGSSVFKSCTRLTSVTIPDSVTSIGDNAFYNCIGLTSVTIPDSVTSIGDNAFYNCIGLTSVTIPDSVTSIGDNAFYNCIGLTSITVDVNNPNYSSDEYGVLFNKDKTILVQYPIGNTRTEYTIPDSVTSIGGYAFYGCTGLTSITIPDSVTSIGSSAFYGCTGLTSITIPDSVTSIGYAAFSWCSKLTSVTIPDSVTSIGYAAFSWCSKLTSVTIPDSVTSIGENAFYNTGIYNDSSNWENDVLYIGNYLIKAKTTISGDYTIKTGTKVIADHAFSSCTGLTSVTIPDSVTSIGDFAFSDCSGLTSVTIPDSVTSIGDFAFSDCSGLTSVTIPDSVTSIGDYAFDGCTGLTSVTIPDSVTSIGRYAFWHCTRLTSVTIPDSVTSIGNYAFYGCNNLSTTYYVGTPEQWRDISIGSYNDPINRNIIFECNSERPNYGKGACGENLTWILYTDGELVIDGTGDMTDYSSRSNVPWYSKKSEIKSVTIPDSVTSIGDYAFYGCTNLEKIAISAYSVEIADNAFDNSPKVIFYCKSGSTVQSYAELNDIMYILIDGPASGFAVKNNQLVAYKGESENPQLPSGVTSIGANSFKDNGTVKTVELPNSVSSIFSGAFSNCSSLERIVVPHTVTTIAPDAFNGTNATIVCYANSYAHQYAVEKGMNVELISVTLNQTKVILSVGEYSIITATPEQEYLDSVQTSWKSSDTGVATVDANGKVTALSNGTATIYALAPTGETLATCSVQVGYSFRITIQNPSTKTISYKSGIILHATADNLPAGAKIVWEKDNDSFSMSDDGNGNCKIISKANGSTTFTAKVKLADGSIAKDSNGNEISAQVTMNSKAGFFDKIVAFFKGLFGGNKVLPQLFKGIF